MRCFFIFKQLSEVDRKGRIFPLFVVSVILITGIGGLAISFGKVTITSVACALILGILTNIILSGKNADAE